MTNNISRSILIFLISPRRTQFASSSQACYCSICEMMLTTSNGKFCDCCGVCADSPKCIKSVDSKLKCKEKVSSTNPAKHLWVKGNVPVHSVCVICDEDVDYHAEPGLFGFRCCWCQRATHTGCLTKTVETGECDFGAFKEMIVQPSGMVTAKSGHSGKLKLTDIVAPDGMDQWKPLFVIGNRFSFYFNIFF